MTERITSPRKHTPAGTPKPAPPAHSAVIPVPRDSREWMERHHAITKRLQTGQARLLWIGDSIVQCWEECGKAVWNHYYAHRGAVNMGISGDKTEHVLWRLDHYPLRTISPELAIIMIGQNNGPFNTAAEIAEGIAAVVTSLRKKCPATRILLLAVFFRGRKPTGERITLATASTLASRMADGRRIFYLDINGVFLRPNGTIPKSLMPDFEHPSAKGCQAWAEAIEPTVAALLGVPPVAP